MSDIEFSVFFNNVIRALKEAGGTEVQVVDMEYGKRIAFYDPMLNHEIIQIYAVHKPYKLVYNKKNPFLLKHVPIWIGQYQPILTVTSSDYIGIDESGKGDYFGPLVLAGFVSDGMLDRELLTMGVSDCKILSDIKVRQIGEQLYERYSDRIACVIYEPLEYNRLYALCKLEGRTMLDLMEKGHDEVISRLASHHPRVQTVLADAISLTYQPNHTFMMGGRKLSYHQRTKAESNPAVAAAGIVARAKFLTWLAKESNTFGVDLYKGANGQVVQSAQMFIQQHSKEALKKVAKIHFKTTQKVLME